MIDTKSDTESWLRLILIPGIGSQTVIRLLSAFGSPDAALSASGASQMGLLSPRQRSALLTGADPELIDQHLRWLEQPGNHFLTLADSQFPRALLEIADPPPALFAKGRTELLSFSQLAIVGSRNATPQGLANAEAFAAELSKGGITIVSGLAQGIDTAAHRGALNGEGSSIAVVGTGLDIVYPSANLGLAHQLARDGLIISEFALGTPGRAGNFPRRNRLISGLSSGVLVVEAALKSGSLITARQAAEQGRDVFAIPGSIHSPMARGCHALIREGAKLVECAEDILEEFTGRKRAAAIILPPLEDTAEAGLLASMGFDPVDIDSICNRCSLTVEDAYAMLLTLELAGSIVRLPGGSFQRI